jgi:guanine deaminase
MLVSGQILLPDPIRGVRLAPGQLRIDGDRIAEVKLSPISIGTPDLGHDRCLISPGFIDTHVHLPQFDCIGIDGLTLLDWLDRAVFPTEARWADADHAADRAIHAAKRMLAAGTTGIAAYATVHHAGAQAAINALGSLGMRGLVGQVLMDQHAPADLLRPAAQLLRETAALKSSGRIDPAVTPRFAVSCSDELLRGSGEIAKRTGWAVQTHLSESIPECNLVQRLHNAPSYTDIYHRAGLLGPRTILGHGIWLDETERKMLRDCGSTIAHCPTANLFLQAGAMDRATRITEGVRLSLGSDVAGGPDPCMVRVARAMIETAKTRRLADGHTPVPTPSEAWAQITWENADALGWTDSGRIAPGTWADLVLIDPTRGPTAQPDWLKAVDPLSLLLYTFDERWIDRTIVQGGMGYVA